MALLGNSSVNFLKRLTEWESKMDIIIKIFLILIAARVIDELIGDKNNLPYQRTYRRTKPRGDPPTRRKRSGE